MSRSALAPALLVLAVGLTACGDGPCGPDEAGNDAGSAAAVSSERSDPLAVGDVAPSFEGLPSGRVVLVFYRGHW